jgi:hypothetical protein
MIQFGVVRSDFKPGREDNKATRPFSAYNTLNKNAKKLTSKMSSGGLLYNEDLNEFERDEEELETINRSNSLRIDDEALSKTIIDRMFSPKNNLQI